MPKVKSAPSNAPPIRKRQKPVRVPPQMLRKQMNIRRTTMPDADSDELERFAHHECVEFLEAARAEEAKKVAALTAVAKIPPWSHEEHNGATVEIQEIQEMGDATSSSSQALPRPSELPRLSAAHQVRVADFPQSDNRKRPPVNLEPPVSWTSAAASASTPPPIAPQAAIVSDSEDIASERKRARRDRDFESPVVGTHFESPDFAEQQLEEDGQQTFEQDGQQTFEQELEDGLDEQLARDAQESGQIFVKIFLDAQPPHDDQGGCIAFNNSVNDAEDLIRELWDMAFPNDNEDVGPLQSLEAIFSSQDSLSKLELHFILYI